MDSMQSKKRDPNFRLPQLRHVLCEGTAWEEPTSVVLDRLCAISKVPKKHDPRFKKKRLGAKKVKTLERLETKGDLLAGEAATLFRALTARANYLALDRPDVAFAAKEL